MKIFPKQRLLKSMSRRLAFLNLKSPWIISILAVVESSTLAFAEEGTSASRVLPYFFMTVFIGIIIAILLSIVAQTKSRAAGRTNITGSALPSSVQGLSDVINKLGGPGAGGKARAEQVMRVFSQELNRKLAEATEELEEKHSKVIEDKDSEINKISHEYDQVKEGYEQVNAEKKHTESLVRSIADGLIIVNEKGEVELANPAAQKLLGAEGGEDIIGKRLLDTVKDEQLVSMLKGAGTDRERDIELKSKSDDTKRVVRASSAVIEDEDGKTVGMVSVLSDITARKEAEEQLRSSESRLRKIIETNADGMIVVDKKGIIRFVNQAAENLFDRSSDELLGGPCGFPVEAGKRMELNIGSEGGKDLVVEIHGVEIKWEEEDAVLVSLRDVTETVRMREELKRLSLSDELTGLYNRRGFVTLAEQQLKIARDVEKGLILFFVDLDNMKWINDNLGHSEGDRALTDVGSSLKEAFRESDIIGRIGGDEFAVLVTDPPEDGTGTFLTGLQQSLETRSTAAGGRHNLSVSVGVAYYDSKHPRVIDDLMGEADKAMYEDKRRKQAARKT